MGKNTLFNNFDDAGEQLLHESLISEAISIYGYTFYYIPREIKNMDKIYGEDTISEYNDAYHLDMYIGNFDGFEGDGQFLSKFNLEIRDQLRLTISRRTFNEELTEHREAITRPREGDLIYAPMMKRIFVIMFVNDKKAFFPLGALPMFDITCEMFEYSNEIFNTGIEEIDTIMNEYSASEDIFNISTSDGYSITDNKGFNIITSDFDFDDQLFDAFADNDELTEESIPIIDWSDRDPFSSFG